MKILLVLLSFLTFTGCQYHQENEVKDVDYIFVNDYENDSIIEVKDSLTAICISGSFGDETYKEKDTFIVNFDVDGYYSFSGVDANQGEFFLIDPNNEIYKIPFKLKGDDSVLEPEKLILFVHKGNSLNIIAVQGETYIVGWGEVKDEYKYKISILRRSELKENKDKYVVPNSQLIQSTTLTEE